MIVTTQLWANLTASLRPGMPMNRPCTACGQRSDAGLHPFVPSPSFADYQRFLGPNGYLCAACYPVFLQGDRIPNTSRGQSWVLSADRTTPLPFRDAISPAFWRETLLHPPEPPFVLTWQLARAVRYLLLFTAVPSLSRDWFPIAFADHQVAWVSPALLTQAFAQADLVRKETAALQKGLCPRHPELQWLQTWTVSQRLLLGLIVPPPVKRTPTQTISAETPTTTTATRPHTKGSDHADSTL